MRRRDAAASLVLIGALGMLAGQAWAQGAEPLPAGHPAVDDGNPHQRAAAAPAMFEPPEDTEQPDPSLSPGTIAVELQDADNRPVPHELVTLGVLINSVAKGDSRKHLQSTTDDRGRAVFTDLELASNIAYRVSAGYQGGAFAAAPFQLQQAKAMRVVLHVYPVTSDIQQALIVTEAVVACEIREDRIQVEEAFTIYNLGRTAWRPDDVRMKLPDAFTAFNAQASMSDQGVEDACAPPASETSECTRQGRARLHGTFPPGRHAIEFRWQLPWSGDKDVDFDVGMPPHVAIARLLMPASSAIKLVASGFPPSEVRRDQQGQSFLVTERRVRPDEPRLASLSIGLHDLPTSGPGKLVATTLAAASLLIGIVLGSSNRGRAKGDGPGAKGIRASLLAELAELERARESGDVGPKTYERARRELMYDLARTLRKSETSPAPNARKKAEASVDEARKRLEPNADEARGA
jgi:hypothetical protein